MAYAIAVVTKFSPPSAENDAKARDFLDKLVEKSEGIWEGFKPQEISNFLWSAATLDTCTTAAGKKLFEKLEARSLANLEGFGNLELQNLVWSVSKGGNPGEERTIRSGRMS